MSRTLSLSPLAVLSVAAAFSLVDSSFAQNAVTNGDFSANAASFAASNGYVGAPNAEDIANWTKSTNGLGINGVGLPNPFGPVDKTAATYYAFLQNGGKNLSQDITAGLTASSAYDVSFVAGNRSNSTIAQGRVIVQDNSVVYYDSGITVWGNAAFKLVESSFLTPASIDGAVTITISNDSVAGDHTVCYSNISITPNTTAPSVSTLSPPDDALSASRIANLVIDFDENVVKGSGDIVIKQLSDDAVVETINVNSATVTISASVVTINPATELARGGSYYVEVAGTAFDDLSGNDFAGISGNSTWNFTISSIDFLPILGDSDSGINSSKTYTHAIDFGNDATAALVNGVQFQTGKPGFGPIAGTAATIGTGTLNLPGSHAGNAGAAPYLIDGAMEDLVRDMAFNANEGVIELTGLTPGVEYQFRLYNRQWAPGDRGQDIGFDTDGVGSTINDTEAATFFEEDNATSPDPGFATATQVYALSYIYTLAPGVTSLKVYINRRNTGSYHLYGLTNEVAAPPAFLSLSPADDSSGTGLGTNLKISFDEFVEKGTGNIVIKESAGGAVVETIDVTSAKVTVNGAVVTINPATILASNTTYFVEIDAGAIVDFSANAFAGISGATTWNFTTTAINFIPISGDADSGIQSSKIYTHAIDFGNDATAALVNGVQFQTGKPGFGPITGTSATIGTGTLNLPSSHPGNGGANAYLIDGAMENLVRDMAYGADNAVITLTDLTPGQEYQIRLYNRQWGAGDRGQNIGFETNGVGTTIADAEARATFEEDNAATPDPGFNTATQVNALTYNYTLPSGVTSLTIYISKLNLGSYHLYGLTNEVAEPPAMISTIPADDEIYAGTNSDLSIRFDEAVQKGSGNIIIKRGSDDSIFETISATSSRVSIDRSLVRINPVGNLDPLTAYYVEIEPGALVDITGNAFAGISGNSTWDFTTSDVYFIPISGDADSEINDSKVYTHAIDFGDNSVRPVATINGVVFANGNPGAFPAIGASSQTVGTGSTTIPNSHPGDDGAAPFLIDGGMEQLVGDMLYNNPNTQIQLTGLTPGKAYRFRLYHRAWEIGFSRQQKITFDTDGFAGAESGAHFNEDNANDPNPGFTTASQVNALTYEYVLEPGVTTLTVNIDRMGTGTYHIYGLTNEELSIYDSWAFENGLSEANALDSTDLENGGAGDGLVNLLEFAFGTNPNLNDNTALIVTDGSNFTPGTQIVNITTPFTPSNVTTVFARRKDAAAAGLTYTPEFSADMSTWQADASAPVPSVVSSQAGDYEIVEVPYLVFLANGQKASFCRIRVNSTGSGLVTP